jgi:Na+/melibiose symporter-like transporter
VQNDLRAQYEQIGRERDEAGRLHDRERFWFWVRVAIVGWVWTIVGGAIMAVGFHMNATIGPYFFPDVMDRAELYVKTGVFVGTTGAFATLMWAWRAAAKRGYFD